MKKFGKRLDLDSFDFSPKIGQKICLNLSNLRKKKSRKGKEINTPLLVPNANYGNGEFEKDQIEANYIKRALEKYLDPTKKYQHPKTLLAKGNFLNEDFASNPEDYEIDPETCCAMQKNTLNTPELGLLAQNLTMHPPKYEDVYPLMQRRIEPAKNLPFANPNVVQSNVPSEQHIEQYNYMRMLPYNVQTIPQPSFAQNNMPLPISYAQADRRTEDPKKMYSEVVKGKPMLKHSENIKKGRANKGIMLHHMQQPPQYFAPQNFGVQHHYHEMPISYVQTERRTGPPREVYAQAVQEKGYAPHEDNLRLNRGPILMAQNFEINQQSHENNQLPMSYPHIEGRPENDPMAFTGYDNNFTEDIGVEPEDTDVNEMGVGTDDMGVMQQHIEQKTQPGYEDPTFEMVKQRYENISPPAPNFQTETETVIDYSKAPLAEAAGNIPPAPPGDTARESENNRMMWQNCDHTRFAQNYDMYPQQHEVTTRPIRNAQHVHSYTPTAENLGLHSNNVGIVQQNMGQTPQPRFIDPTFEMNRRRYERLTRPILMPQTGVRTEPARKGSSRSGYVGNPHTYYFNTPPQLTYQPQQPQYVMNYSQQPPRYHYYAPRYFYHTQFHHRSYYN